MLHQRTPWDSADPELKAPDGADVPEEPAADRAVPELTAAPSGSQPAAEHAAEDSSSSASDQSADGADLEGIMADPSAAEFAAWFKQGAKTHIVSERTEEGRLVPYCRDLPFAQDPHRRGEGFVRDGLVHLSALPVPHASRPVLSFS